MRPIVSIVETPTSRPRRTWHSVEARARFAWGTILAWATCSRPSLLTKAAAEFTGCAIFHFLGTVSPTPATNAIALMVMVYYTAKLSGAHLNPALTTTFAMLGYVNPVEVLVYWAAQISGTIVSALWIGLMVPGLWAHEPGPDGIGPPLSGCFSPGADVSPLRVFGWEATCTFCFILPIFSVVWYTQSKSGYGNTGPIIVGLSLFAAASAAAPWTGASLNPARTLGSIAVFGRRSCPAAVSSAGYYIAGELVGGALVPLAVAPWYGVSQKVAQRMRVTAYGSGTAEFPQASTPASSEAIGMCEDGGTPEDLPSQHSTVVEEGGATGVRGLPVATPRRSHTPRERAPLPLWKLLDSTQSSPLTNEVLPPAILGGNAADTADLTMPEMTYSCAPLALRTAWAQRRSVDLPRHPDTLSRRCVATPSPRGAGGPVSNERRSEDTSADGTANAPSHSDSLV